MENHSARPRHCQWRLRRGRESRGIRRQSGKRRSWTGILGKFVCGRSLSAKLFPKLRNDKEEILVVECDPAKSEETRRNWPFLRDRRIDAYPPILNRWLGELTFSILSDSVSSVASVLNSFLDDKRRTTPHALGFRMPAEWEPHEATWLGWPHELTDWPGKFAPIPWAFAEIVRHLVAS